ncbi:MAG: ParB/RepB/Spo0J family partition protein, partial [Oscillospiraceae bacterium]
MEKLTLVKTSRLIEGSIDMLNFMEKVVNKVVMIDIDSIVPNPSQPRTYFNQDDIVLLAASIKENGLLQPITVRKSLDGKYELISGERRLRAIIHNKNEKAPCIIIDSTSRQSAVFALLENIQRSDLNYFEEAVAYKNLLTEWGITQQEVASRLGVAQSTVANKIRLLKYSSEQQNVLIDNMFNERQSRAVLKLADRLDFKTQVEFIAKSNYNVK